MTGPSETAPRGRSPWRAFLRNLGFTLALALAALFTGIAVTGERAVEGEIRARARALVNAMLLIRAWNEGHGGVLVPRSPPAPGEPPTYQPDVIGQDGRAYAWVPHAVMTREVSEIAERQGDFRFRITSLRPLAARNAPDAFEADALHRFEGGATEAEVREQRDGSTWFRYAVPLRAEPSCLRCHQGEGERLGGVRGALSVAFQVDHAEEAVARSRLVAAGLWVVTCGGLLLLLGRMVARLNRRLDEAQARIRELAITDGLTGLRNRRHAQEWLAGEVARALRHGRPLSCVLFDVDHFKQVNDGLGHEAGDQVLRAVSAAVLAGCRRSDVAARWGGEEFLVVLPETTAEGARTIADRLREEIAAARVPVRGGEVRVTASFGVAELPPGQDGGEPEAEALVRAADEAMYRAKAAGRNRVVVA